MTTSVVYFVQAVLPTALIKIGATMRIDQRLATLRSSSPCELRLLGMIEDAHAERHAGRLHTKFAAQRVHHEWFAPSTELLAYIDAHARLSHEGGSGAAPRAVREAMAVPLDSLVTLQEIAARLRVSPATVRRRVHDGVIEYVRVGRQLRFVLPDHTNIK